jgi:hypothetical protein
MAQSQLSATLAANYSLVGSNLPQNGLAPIHLSRRHPPFINSISPSPQQNPPSHPTLIIFPSLFRYPRRTKNRRYGTERYIQAPASGLFIIGSLSGPLLLFYLISAASHPCLLCSLLYSFVSLILSNCQGVFRIGFDLVFPHTCPIVRRVASTVKKSGRVVFGLDSLRWNSTGHGFHRIYCYRITG